MVLSDNSIGIAQGLIAPILNWLYMVINPINMIFFTALLFGISLNWSAVKLMVMSVAVNLPGLVLLFN
jgi:hypothetical protein